MKIFHCAIQEGIYPTDFKTEFISPIPKSYPPQNYEELRPLSLTQFFSRKCEELILKVTSSVKGLLHYINKYIDPNQFAKKGYSCTHALIKIINFIMKIQTRTTHQRLLSIC